MADVKSKTLALVAAIDPAELTVRLLEIGCKIKRPIGVTGRDALAQVRDGGAPKYIVDDFEAMAAAAMAYVAECINAGKRPS